MLEPDLLEPDLLEPVLLVDGGQQINLQHGVGAAVFGVGVDFGTFTFGVGVVGRIGAGGGVGVGVSAGCFVVGLLDE